MKVDIQDIWIDRVGMAAIVAVSLGYVLFGNAFAQLGIKFSFLDFPVFIGEILLGLTSLLFIFKSVRRKDWELGRWGWVLGVYLFFVLLKAFSGYFVWGPLAFRDAALFYYPFFTVLGYSFWSHVLWGEKTRRLFIIVILSIFILHQCVDFWPCSLVILGVILALQAKSFQERMVLIGAVILFAPYGVLLDVFLRTIFLSSMITAIFIATIFFLLFCKDKLVLRIVGIVLGCLVLGGVLFKASQTGVLNTYVIKDAKPLVTPSSQEPPRGQFLFHPVGGPLHKPDAIKSFLSKTFKGNSFVEKQGLPEKQGVLENQGALEKKYTPENKTVVEKGNDTLRVKEDDTRFRYYIWRDMAYEYLRYKPFFGFDFGRPLRSPTMDYYRISSPECSDGWVGAHNSLLYMIYRAGIVGLVMVLSILFIWSGLLRDFYIWGDWTGILLCAVLLNWFVSANFFLIFELPYTAIPVWMILGITLKYRMQLKNALNAKI